ncbi:hypothetical protein OPIT5_29715 [Opitutaceae bacterium TAV5]|nr:hypothetical protein OPIT5_29715 [Opitutaceae bacterium TAV5]
MPRSTSANTHQSEFLFSDGPVPELAPPDALTDLVTEIARCWRLPLMETTRITLRSHEIDEVCGRLELVAAPDLPLNPHREPLRLRVRGVEFTSNQIVEWSLA